MKGEVYDIEKCGDGAQAEGDQEVTSPYSIVDDSLLIDVRRNQNMSCMHC